MTIATICVVVGNHPKECFDFELPQTCAQAEEFLNKKFKLGVNGTIRMYDASEQLVNSEDQLIAGAEYKCFCTFHEHNPHVHDAAHNAAHHAAPMENPPWKLASPHAHTGKVFA